MRALLFVPGDSQHKLEKALDSGADVLLLDLEDSVSQDNKKDARRITAEFIRQNAARANSPLFYVRINSFDSGLLEDDLAAVMSSRPHGILLPKSDHGSDVTRLDARLNVYEAENDIDEGSTRLMAIITETARGMLNTATYHNCSKRLTAMTWGAEDLAADIGAVQQRHSDGRYRDVFRHARTMALLGAVNAGVMPIDTVFTDYKDLAGLRSECSEAAAEGFLGKMAIHPAQVSVINEIFTPSDEAIAEARAIVDAFANSANQGVVGLNGKMLDRPHLRRAEALLARI